MFVIRRYPILEIGAVLALLGWVSSVGCTRSARAGLIGTPPSQVTTYRVFELAMSANTPGANPYVNGPTVTATFTGTSGAAAGKVLTLKGFWDGGNVWRVRFAATATGDWSYTTSSIDPGLNGISGTVTAVGPTPPELAANSLYRGFLERDGTHAWKLSDGTSFLPVGDTQWSFSEEFTTSEWQQWMDARQTQKFNTFLGSIWLAIYSRAGVPEAFPGKDPIGSNENLQVSYFQRLDQLVQYANDRGIMMGLTIGGFPDNSNWWVKFGTLARNDRWFRYCVARYAACNVRWCLYGEVNERNPPAGWGGGITTWQAQVAHDAQLVKDEDPYDHPIGSHATSIDTSSANNANIDYIEVQIGSSANRTETQYQSALNYRSYGKPVWFEEYWYEPAEYDNDYLLGIRNTHRSFVSAMAFPTMGSLMRAHYPNFNVSQVTTDPGAVRMSYFYDFFKNLDMVNFTPSGGLANTGQCGRFGNAYAIFLQGGGSVTLNLTGAAGTFNVRKLDINTGATANLPDVAGGGQRTINSGTSSDVCILVSPGPAGPNQAPAVSAGFDQSVLGVAAVNLDGNVTDDGLPIPPGAFATQWSKVSGPGTVIFGNASAIDTTASFSTAGAYVLRLTADDGELQASDDVAISVGVPGDFNGDFDVDQSDFSRFQLCLSGSGNVEDAPACVLAHLDGDPDVDGIDLDLFLGCMSGANITGNPGCRMP